MNQNIGEIFPGNLRINKNKFFCFPKNRNFSAYTAVNTLIILRRKSIFKLLFLQQHIDPREGAGDYWMKHSLFDILIKPGTFFQGAVKETENFKIPGLIVLALGIVSAIYAYLIGGVTGRMMAGLFPGMESIISIFTILGALVGIFIFWVIWTGVFYLVSTVFKGKGTFKRTLEFTGYGFLPQIFGMVLAIIVAVQYLPRVIVPQITTAAIQNNPQLVQEAVNMLMHDPAMLEMTQIVTVISIIFLLWSANIWISGMRNARQLSERDSALCVGIPVVIYILYSIFTMTGI
jgi:hypothetical protein